MKQNIKIAKQLLKIAKELKAKNVYDAMDQKTLKYFKTFFKNLLGQGWNIESHDGSSYDGFMSFTEGYVEGTTYYSGYDAQEWKSADEINKDIDYIKESFYHDHKDLFEGKEEKEAIELINETNEQIWQEYEEYESNWLFDIEGTLFLAIQFDANGDSYNTTDWTCNIYSGRGDSYGRRQEYLYEDSIDFININDPGIISQIENKVKQAYEKIKFERF